MNDHNENELNQEQDYGNDFRKKVAHALSSEGTVEALQEHPDDLMMLHLDNDESVVMQGDELDAWLAEEDNRKAFFDAQEDRKNDDAEHDRDLASRYDADADIGEFSLGEERQKRATSQDDSATNSNKADREQERKPNVEAYDPTNAADKRFCDLQGNPVTLKEMEDRMRSRAEVKQHLDNDRRSTQLASGYDREAVREQDRRQSNDTRSEYHQSVAEEVNAQAKQSAGQESTATSSTDSSKPSRGDLARARAAQFAAEPEEEKTRKQSQVQSH